MRAGRARPSPCRMSSEASLAAASSSAGPHSSRTARRTTETSRGAATSQSCEQAGQAMLRREGPHRCGLVATTGVTLLARTPPCEAWRTYPVAPSRRAPPPPAVAARLPSPSRQARGPSRSHCVWKGVCSHGLGASAVLAWAGPAGPTATTTGARPRGCERSIAYVVDLWHAAGANRRKHVRGLDWGWAFCWWGRPISHAARGFSPAESTRETQVQAGVDLGETASAVFTAGWKYLARVGRVTAGGPYRVAVGVPVVGRTVFRLPINQSG